MKEGFHSSASSDADVVKIEDTETSGLFLYDIHKLLEVPPPNKM